MTSMRSDLFARTEISRLALGTVQFGVDYGINNVTGQIPIDEVRAILATAHERGVNFLDTARTYGTSEEIIGKTLAEMGLADEFVVCTKLDLPEDYRDLSDSEVLRAVGEALEQSLEALQISTLPLYLLHRDHYKTHRDGLVWDYLVAQKRSGRISALGLSAGMKPAEAIGCMDDPEIDAIQIPYNIIDARWQVSGVLERAAREGIFVISRSVYLQGLLLMELDEVARKIPPALPYLRKLTDICRQLGVSRKELAMQFVMSESLVSTTIVGVDSVVQFQENARIAERADLTAQELTEIREQFLNVPDNVVIPYLWKARDRASHGSNTTKEETK